MPDPNPFRAIHECISFGCYDWSNYENHAWIYGVIIGWESAASEIQKKYGWSDHDMLRLQQQHEAYQLAEKSYLDSHGPK